MMTIRKNDTVAITTGKEKGKKGKINDLFVKKGKVMVQGIALESRHSKARKQGETSSIKKKESWISISNVMPICTSCKKPARINMKLVEGKRVRMCNRCKEIF